MQRKFVEYKKRTTEEMDALRQENARLKRKVEGGDKGKEKENPQNTTFVQKTTLEIEEGSGNNNTKTRGTTNTLFIIGGNRQHHFVHDC